ncbi:MAG TPA: DUF6065 family protein [Tepidisphaeraceae bacterium]|jgi:LPS sulfotransferase NodH|nr:DUF6065 family protein [Tepidisphaeraceae bacterium]
MENPTHCYFICTNPRSGSWLLSEGLALTSVAGNAREWFQDEEERAQSAAWGIDRPTPGNYASYLARVFQNGSTANGVFGAKIMYYQFVDLPAKIARVRPGASPSVAQSLSAVFSQLQYIWLRRRDTARQAISYHRACQTDVWWQIEGEANPMRPGTTAEPVFDAQAITRLERELVQNDLSWQKFFENNGIAPLTLFYEDLADDYVGVLADVLKWLGQEDVDLVSIPPPRLKKQADAQTEEWLARYLANGRRSQSPNSAMTSPGIRGMGGPPMSWTGENIQPADARSIPGLRVRTLPNDLRGDLHDDASADSSAAKGPAPLAPPLTSNAGLEVRIYQLAGDEMFKGRRPAGTGWDWSWASPQRQWMTQTQNKFAYRCLPLTIANQTGWWVYNPVGFSATWDGNPADGNIQFQFDAEPELWSSWIGNQFGHGIITWNTPFLFRTKPAGSRLLIAGPANYFKHGIQPLTAIMESDWMIMSFTMNWKFTAPNLAIRFEAGEPIFQAIPLISNPCTDMESAEVSYLRLADDPAVADEYARWNESRRGFHQQKAAGVADADDWQKDYFKGRDGAGRVAAAHTTKVTAPPIHYVSARP